LNEEMVVGYSEQTLYSDIQGHKYIEE